jgi:4'-phosphopantetheinyl transferase
METMKRVESDEIAVWLCRVESLSGADLASMSALLSEEEHARCDRLVLAEDRRAFTAAHALLRTALSRYGARPPREWRFETTAHGKPFLAPQTGHPPLSFNLSHTRTTVACAVAAGADLGLDVEEGGRRSDGLGIAARYFTAGERQWLDACPPEEVAVRFVELWTLKEAYIKAVGLGLRVRLDSFELSFGEATRLTFHGPDDASSWQFWLSALSPSTRIALAAPAQKPWRISWWGHDGAPASGVTLLRSSA